MSEKMRQWIKSGLMVVLIALIVSFATGVNGDLAKSPHEETYEGLKLFSDVIEEIEKNYVETVDPNKLIQNAIKGMVNSLDPHSAFLPPEAFEELQTETKGEFGGIGIVITKEENRLTVISPIEGTPAYKAGIKAQDVITKIDGKSTKDMELWEAVKLMRGDPGSSVDVTILREGAEKPLDFTLVRGVIPLDSVRSVELKPGYGYIWITNFRENTADEVKKALQKLENGKTPLRGLIVDLRDNPGGLLDQAVKVSDIFLESGTIVSIRGRDDKEVETYKAHPESEAKGYPIVLLINGGSASAAEIVAGALKDNHRALVLGTTSFGKGSVQTVKPLRDGYALKYTIARYYTPSGRSIQAEGIKPDLVVKRRLLDETAGDGVDAHMIKEGDLKNHLPSEKELNNEALPGAEKNTDLEKTKGKTPKDNSADDETDTKKILRLRETLYQHGKSNSDALLLDSQVNRAYEILKGYDIFRGLSEK